MTDNIEDTVCDYFKHRTAIHYRDGVTACGRRAIGGCPRCRVLYCNTHAPQHVCSPRSEATAWARHAVHDPADYNALGKCRECGHYPPGNPHSTWCPTGRKETRYLTNRQKDAHDSHCNQGEWVGSCKYGDDEKCPTLAPVLARLARLPLGALRYDLMEVYNRELSDMAPARVRALWLRDAQPGKERWRRTDD